MLTDDGILVAEVGFWKRVHAMYLVFMVACSPEMKANYKMSYSKFISVSLQYIFIGRYRAFSKAEMKELNHV